MDKVVRNGLTTVKLSEDGSVGTVNHVSEAAAQEYVDSHKEAAPAAKSAAKASPAKKRK